VRPLTADDRAENQILGVLLVQPDRWHHVQERLAPSSFTDETRQKLAEVYWSYQRDEGEPAFNELLGHLEEPELKELAIAVTEEVEALGDLELTLSGALLHLEQARARSKENKLLSESKRTSDSTRSEIDILREAQELARKPDIRRTAT
jgi:hypothetical protein